jgi:hypothetical protein
MLTKNKTEEHTVKSYSTNTAADKAAHRLFAFLSKPIQMASLLLEQKRDTNRNK